MKKRFSYFRWFLFLFFLLSVPFLPIGNYQLHIIIIGCIYAVMVLSLNLITGYVGELSLGNVAFFGVGAFTSALLTLGGVSFWVSFLAAGMVAGIFGSLIGYITLKLRGAYFVIVTLAFAEILRLIDTNWTSLTNGPMGLSNIPLPEIHIPYLLNITFSDKIHFYYLSLGLLLLALYVVYRLVNSRIGRAWVSIRENEDLAKSIGINAFNYALLAFVVGAIFTGLGGSVYAHYMSFMGLPLCNADDGEYFWLQTAGPCWVQPGSWADDRLPGRAPNFREVYAAIDGAVTCSWVFGAFTDGYQRVGYLLDATYHEYGSVFIMLQLEG